MFFIDKEEEDFTHMNEKFNYYLFTQAITIFMQIRNIILSTPRRLKENRFCKNNKTFQTIKSFKVFL